MSMRCVFVCVLHIVFVFLEPPTVLIRIDSILVSPQSSPIILMANTEAPQLLCEVTGLPLPLVSVWLQS